MCLKCNRGQLCVKRSWSKVIYLRIGEDIIETTPMHPFWVEGYGFKEAGELSEENNVETAAGVHLSVTRVEKEHLENPVTVYNLEVEDWHT